MMTIEYCTHACHHNCVCEASAYTQDSYIITTYAHTCMHTCVFVIGCRHIGHINIMYSSLLLYAVRFAIYGALTNPWWVLPAEVLQGTC